MVQYLSYNCVTVLIFKTKKCVPRLVEQTQFQREGGGGVTDKFLENWSIYQAN